MGATTVATSHQGLLAGCLPPDTEPLRAGDRPSFPSAPPLILPHSLAGRKRRGFGWCGWGGAVAVAVSVSVVAFASAGRAGRACGGMMTPRTGAGEGSSAGVMSTEGGRLAWALETRQRETVSEVPSEVSVVASEASDDVRETPASLLTGTLSPLYSVCVATYRPPALNSAPSVSRRGEEARRSRMSERFMPRTGVPLTAMSMSPTIMARAETAASPDASFVMTMYRSLRASNSMSKLAWSLWASACGSWSGTAGSAILPKIPC
mmetsp:Transcript_13698/g.27094  ORF Transcript_13698/g.27094 Transcript_13698/m.27094 type:complete len:264 (-) Transcript_13698:225-1016(-)